MAGEKLTGTKKSRQYKALEEMEEKKKRENTPPPDPGKQPPVAPVTDAPVAEIKPAPAAGTTTANDGDAHTETLKSSEEPKQENS